MPLASLIYFAGLFVLATISLFLNAYYLSSVQLPITAPASREPQSWHPVNQEPNPPNVLPVNGHQLDLVPDFVAPAKEDELGRNLEKQRMNDQPSKITPTEGASSKPDHEGKEHSLNTVQILGKGSFTRISDFMQAALEWVPPVAPWLNHWPPYNAYGNQKYDPNRWEGFDRETGYYLNSSVKLLPQSNQSPKPYLPYPDYEGENYRKHWKGAYVVCKGPRGLTLDKSPSDQVYAYKGPATGFPAPSIGSFEHLGIASNVCFDRYSRYGAYGLTAGQHSTGTRHHSDVDWDRVDWADLQDKCILRNKGRYFPRARFTSQVGFGIEIPEYFDRPGEDEQIVRNPFHNAQKYHPRTAVLIRSWEGYEYTANDLQAIRALITELSLSSGGEYTVVLLVQFKSVDQFDIHHNPMHYEEALNANVPQELRSIAVLWTEQMCQQMYPKVGNWHVYLQQWMPVQWFAATHPEFDFFWNWETDIRYVGHHYEFLEQVSNFARNQRRRLLWERNKRFWIPSIHGNFDRWYSDTNAKVEAATRDGHAPEPVWGPQPYGDNQKPLGPEAPNPNGAVSNAWGVGEEADLITLLPIWDPRGTKWSFRSQIWNFVPGMAPNTKDQILDMDFDPPQFANIQRRVSISTVVRVSRPLLRAMHLENKQGRSMQAEMWPATIALHHGFKAVYAPHPIWWDRKWPSLYADAVFNAHAEDDYDGHDAPKGLFANEPKPKLNGAEQEDFKMEGGDHNANHRLSKQWKRANRDLEPSSHYPNGKPGTRLRDFGLWPMTKLKFTPRKRRRALRRHAQTIPERHFNGRLGIDTERYPDVRLNRQKLPTNPNAGSINPAQWGERADSPYNHDREWNFVGWSWYYRSSFAGTLYRRFLGYMTPEVHETGEAEEDSPESTPPSRLGEVGDVYGGMEWEESHGRICLPGMFLHPIKKVAGNIAALDDPRSSVDGTGQEVNI